MAKLILGAVKNISVLLLMLYLEMDKSECPMSKSVQWSES